MKIWGIELEDWKEYGAGFTRESKTKLIPYEFIDLDWEKGIIFGHKLRLLEIIFYEQYPRNYIKQLSFDEIKQLIDQFLVNMNNLKAFL